MRTRTMVNAPRTRGFRHRTIYAPQLAQRRRGTSNRGGKGKRESARRTGEHGEEERPLDDLRDDVRGWRTHTTNHENTGPDLRGQEVERGTMGEVRSGHAFFLQTTCAPQEEKWRLDMKR